MTYVSAIKENYNVIADEYDETYYQEGIQENQVIEEYLAEFVRRTEIDSMLELGCGTGYWLKYMADFGLHNICGIDFAESMVSKARERCSEYSNIEVKTSTIPQGLTLSSQYDLIFTSYFLSSLLEEQDILDLLEKSKSLLTSNSGRFIVVENKLPEEAIAKKLDICLLKINEMWNEKMLNCQYRLYSNSRLEKIFQEAGYEVEDFVDINDDIYLYVFKR